MEVSVNYFAILLAGIVSMAIGFFWYSPMLFGNAWIKLMGYTKESLKKANKDMGKVYSLSFVLSLVTAYVLSHVMTLSQHFYGYGQVETGLTTAFWLWLGFVMPVQYTEVMFGGKKFHLFAINTGYQLASILAMGIVIGLM